jgi:dTDP-4-dehydrorhamnose 3,5-epimerase
MLKGITLKPLKRNCDERGCFTEIMRKDWKDFLEEDQLVQTNFSMTYPGVIRAWHRHNRGQIDYFILLKGALKICAYDEETKELDEITSTGLDLQILRMPGEYWHGYKAVGDEPAFLIYFTTSLYDYKSPDEERRPWNDPKIAPQLINGKKDDPRTGKPWDWNQPPHK